MPNEVIDWSKLNIEQRSKFYSDILTYAATHRYFRDCCLNSSRSARVAIEKAIEDGKIKPKITFPSDFSIEFVNAADCEESTTRNILRIPDYKGEDAQIDPIPAAGNVACTYAHW